MIVIDNNQSVFKERLGNWLGGDVCKVRAE